MYKILLSDKTWHPCEITGKTIADDYIGYRYHLKLSESVQGIGLKAREGFVFYDCHQDCIRTFI